MVIGSLVKGLMPARSFVAGFFTTRSLTSPGTTNSPGPRAESCLRMSSCSDSKQRPTLFLSRSEAFAISATTCAFVSLFPAMRPPSLRFPESFAVFVGLGLIPTGTIPAGRQTRHGERITGMEQRNQGERNNPGAELSFFYGSQHRGGDGVAAARPVSSPLRTACLVLCGGVGCGYAGSRFRSKATWLAPFLRAFWQFAARLWPALGGLGQWRQTHELARHRHHLPFFARLRVIVADEM